MQLGIKLYRANILKRSRRWLNRRNDRMYELNGIVYAGNPTPMKKVIYAEYRGNYMIRVAFNTGEVVDVNFTHGFDGSAFGFSDLFSSAGFVCTVVTV